MLPAEANAVASDGPATSVGRQPDHHCARGSRKNENEVPWGINRRRVVTLNDGKPGERSVSMACMHCTDAPCAAVCPVNCFYTTADAVVLHSKDLCIGCGYCFYACPFGAPQYPKVGNFGSRGKMDKCTYCAGGPEPDGSKAQYEKYGADRLAEGKLPLCAEMCSTKSLLAGDGEVIAQIYKERVSRRGYGSGAWGWQTASRATNTKSYVLEHPAGRDWQYFHNVTLRWIAAIAILGLFGALVIFYLVRGSVKLESGFSGRKIVRFNWFERFVP